MRKVTQSLFLALTLAGCGFHAPSDDLSVNHMDPCTLRNSATAGVAYDRKGDGSINYDKAYEPIFFCADGSMYKITWEKLNVR